MTDRVKALTVILDKNYREDDIQALCDAILCFRAVIKVEKYKTEPGDLVERERIRQEYFEKMRDLFFGEGK